MFIEKSTTFLTIRRALINVFLHRHIQNLAVKIDAQVKMKTKTERMNCEML